jgi:hypothetical protein
VEQKRNRRQAVKRLIIIVEGQTEAMFVKEILAPYLGEKGLVSVTPIMIATSNTSKGGFVNYRHLKNDVLKRIGETDVVISTFVDYFRMPDNMPNYADCQAYGHVDERVARLEKSMKEDINSPKFIPYIQKHEFEALLFASNTGFEELYKQEVFIQTAGIIDTYNNPEEINTHPDTAPSKRLKAIIKSYEKVVDGNLIALEIGIETMLEKCPRFRSWVESLIRIASEGV